MNIETVMAMPFCRFLALQRTKTRRSIESANATRRQQWEAENRS